MGKITKELITLIKKQVEDHGIVVWYDPERVYTDLVGRLNLPETTILQFEGSFFELRYRMEPLLEFVDENGHLRADAGIPPRLLVYVPLNQAETQHALIEAEAAGVVMQPGASPWQRNTRLKVLAERIFKHIAPDRASSIARDVEAGRFTLEDLESLADQTGDVGAIKLIFGTTAIVDVALSFVSSDKHDESIAAKQALPELTGLFRSELGLEINPEQSIAQVREALGQSLLLAELALKAGANNGIPEKLAAIPVPAMPRQREQLLTVCHEWRNRGTYRKAYAHAARKIEQITQVYSWLPDPQLLRDVETFPCVETCLLEWTETQLLENDAEKVLGLIENRKTSFWPSFDVENQLQLRWTILEAVSRLLMAAGNMEADLRRGIKGPTTMVNLFVKNDVKGELREPWFMLDRYHRRLESRYATFDFLIGGEHALLEKVVRFARKRYEEVVGRCAENFAKTLHIEKYPDMGVLKQTEILSKKLTPLVTEAKTAYVLVDALRFEMGLEMVEGLEEEFDDIETIPCIAQLPTITEIGMAALVRNSREEMTLVDVGNNHVGVQTGEDLLKDRNSRIKHFTALFGHKNVYVMKLNDLMKPTEKEHEALAEADLILVTSQEIDRRGEEVEDEEEARRFMDDVLRKLRRGVRQLAASGVRHIVITADHGYLFVERLQDDMKISPPGGHTADLHPRVWIGRGGADLHGCLRVTSKQIGLGGDLELVFPLGLACFKARGARGGYFHGGISLQEMVIPLTILRGRERPKGGLGNERVTMKLSKPVITNRFFSVELTYEVSGLSTNLPKHVRVVARSGDAEVGIPAMAAYGFQEGSKEIALKKNKTNPVTMMLTTEKKITSLSLHVLDAKTHIELCSVKKVPVDLTI